MVSIVNAIVGAICCIIADVFLTLLIILQVHLYAKKRWNKNVKTYPYFNYPVHKKIFLLGLKGALSRGAVVMTFIAHLATLLIIIFCILICCLPDIEAISYCFRGIAGVELALMLFRAFWQWASPPNL